MLEDSLDDAYLIERVLKKEKVEFQNFVVDSRDEFIDGLTDFDPDIILSDHSLPQFNSREALKLCSKIKPNVPFILVTGTVSEEFAISILKQGASNYILKSNLSRLVPAIEQALKQKELEKNKRDAEEALKAQNIELKRLNNELDKFVYSASHDLRSPLTGLMGLLHIARKNINQPDLLEEYLQKMQDSVDKLDNILVEILEYSYNARFEVSAEKIDINVLVTQSLANLDHLPGYHQINIETEIQQDAELFSDRFRLGLIISSLLKNAIQFFDNSKTNPFIQINIQIGKNLDISIKDNGVGIGKKHLDNIFDMFFRASNLSNGAGLGLYIAKDVVTRLNGTIQVKSQVGKGTEFSVSLPVMDSTKALSDLSYLSASKT